ncbi:MAG: hypothetical protein KH202_00005, partial [Clostridiales bacterium]|nr:hypothetical protein [Clostridiales bacterium]
CALAKKCAGKPMVSCLMGDSTALASAIVRCCPNVPNPCFLPAAACGVSACPANDFIIGGRPCRHNGEILKKTKDF